MGREGLSPFRERGLGGLLALKVAGAELTWGAVAVEDALDTDLVYCLTNGLVGVGAIRVLGTFGGALLHTL